MKPENNLQKNIGVVLGVMTILGVFVVTIVLSKHPLISSSSLTQNSTDISPVNNTSPDTSSNIPTDTLNSAQQASTNTPPNTTTSTTPTPPPPVDIPKNSSTISYKDGTYTATGSYDSPAGIEQIGVTLALKNSIVTSSSVTALANDNTSMRYQNMFISGYQPYVVGKDISTIALATVSGSSLTGMGFNSALAKIKSQASGQPASSFTTPTPTYTPSTREHDDND